MYPLSLYTDNNLIAIAAGVACGVVVVAAVGVIASYGAYKWKTSSVKGKAGKAKM